MADNQHPDILAAMLEQYSKPQPELRAGDPSVFREPTLLNMLLGRYAPSGMLAQYYNPETREGAASARRWGGLMDDALLSLLGIRSPRGADRATGAMLDKRAERLGTYGDDIMKPGVDWPGVLERGYGGMHSAGKPNPAMTYRSPVEMQTGQPRVPRWDNENPATLWPTELPTSGPGFNVPSGYGSLEAALAGPHGPAILARIRGRTADEARQGFQTISGGKPD